VSTVALTQHPDRATLLAFRAGRLSAAERVAVAEHLTRCPACSDGSSADTPTCHDPSGPPRVFEEGNVPAPLVDHPRYQVLDRIGEGGMGVVYRAEHRVMGRVVALKVLNAGVTANPVAIDRFHREVRLASRLNHPHIVTAYDADEAGGLHFLVMEFVEGMSLDQVVRVRGPLPVATACECARQAALGLQHAHDKGMIHRDVKPHNLMLTRTGQVKILDFGLARVAHTDGLDPLSVTAQALTQPQTLLGTPDFLSPEQARSAVALDARSDLYSLGCTLYYLLTGAPPYGGVGAYAKMIAHVKDPIPDLLAARPDAPSALGALVRKLLAKDPAHRFATATEVAAGLLPFARPITDADGPVVSTAGHEPAARSWAETLPSCASDGKLPALPLAEECEPNETEPLVVEEPDGPPPVAPEPGRRRFATAALLALVVLGLGLGAAVSQRHRFTGTPHAAAEPPAAPAPPREVKGAAHEPSAEPVLPSEPKPKPVKDTPKPKPVEPAPAPTSPPPAAPGRKKHVLILVPNDFAYGEFALVTDSLKQRGMGVSVVAPEKRPIDGYRYGTNDRPYVKTIDPDFGVKDVPVAVLDTADAAIVLPGDQKAFGPKGSAGLDFARIIKKMIQQKKVVGAVASGIVPLGAAGFLEHVEVSTYTAGSPTTIMLLKVKKWTPDPKVIVDLPFVTGGEYGSARSVLEEVLKAIPEHPGR
jgi:serine/threonine-protein kinase